MVASMAIKELVDFMVTQVCHLPLLGQDLDFGSHTAVC